MTKLELTIDGIKTTWESQDSDLTVSELLEAFAGLLVAQSYQPASVVRSALDYAEERHEMVG